MFNKQTNADELEIASELCIAVAMTKPVNSLLIIVQRIIDDHELTNNNISYNHTWVLARMLVRVMLILCWAEGLWRDKRSRFLEWRRHNRKRKATQAAAEGTTKNSEILGDPTHSPPHEESEKINPNPGETVHRTLQMAFLMFEKEIKPSLIRLRITFICFFMFELAMAPQGEYRRRLIEMIPDDMVSSYG